MKGRGFPPKESKPPSRETSETAMNSGQFGIGQTAAGRAKVSCLGGRVTEFLARLDRTSTRGCADRARTADIVLSQPNNGCRHHLHGQHGLDERVRVGPLLVRVSDAAGHDARQIRGTLACAARRFTARELSACFRASRAPTFAEINYQVAPNQSLRDNGVLAKTTF